MAQITSLHINGVMGKIHSFSAKTAASTPNTPACISIAIAHVNKVSIAMGHVNKVSLAPAHVNKISIAIAKVTTLIP